MAVSTSANGNELTVVAAPPGPVLLVVVVMPLPIMRFMFIVLNVFRFLVFADVGVGGCWNAFCLVFL